MRRFGPLLAALVLACACGASEEPAPAPVEEPAPRPAIAPESPPATPPAPAAVVGGACASDADCGWDDTCVPAACVSSPPAPTGCGEAAPPPGTCACVFGRCALRPSADRAPPPSEADCEGYGALACGLDVGRARCEPGRADDLSDEPERFTGPRCFCDSHLPRRCRFEWVDGVACDDNDDCWVEVDPFLRPIARPARLRGRAFRPCRDGEHAPVCREGRCALVGFGC